MPTHEFQDHIGDVRLRVSAASLEGILAEAARALGQLERESIAPTPERVSRVVRLGPAEPGRLLVDWLNELIFLSETEAWVPEEAEVSRTESGQLEAVVTGPRLVQAPALVKAATHHEVRCARVGAGWEAEVILDV
jgi:SHS2 domain-containing protein